MELRDYQQAAIAAVMAARKRGVRRQVVCLPTGAGKTVIFARLAAIARRPVLVLVHRSELVEQAAEKIGRALGDPAQVQVEQGTRRAGAGVKAVVASIRSLSPARIERLRGDHAPGLVIYDECHHAPAEDNLRVLRQLGAFEPEWTGTLVGFTATPVRADGLGLDEVFQEIVFEKGLRAMIAEGWLRPLRGVRIDSAADLRAICRAGSLDFAPEELELAVDVSERNALVARSIQELARDRRTIVFCAGVAHATSLARALVAVGVPAGVVHGGLAPEARAEVLGAFRRGALRALTNVAVLTEGFDDPGVSCVAMARPTRSPGLYAQCVGRGMRLDPGARDCLVLDFVDLSSLPLVTLPSLFGLPREVDLQGEEAAEAAARYEQLLADNPGFEVEPGAITLQEIEERARRFDPLGLAPGADVRAISPHAWESLGSRGLALHFERRPGKLSECLVLDEPGRGRRWRVLMDGREVARFGSSEEAVEAVDYEVGRRGAHARASALPRAAWRRAAVPAPLLARLRGLRGQNQARDLGEAVRLLAFAEHGPVARAGALGRARRAGSGPPPAEPRPGVAGGVGPTEAAAAVS